MYGLTVNIFIEHITIFFYFNQEILLLVVLYFKQNHLILLSLKHL